jgi:hypothetical protein
MFEELETAFKESYEKFHGWCHAVADFVDGDTDTGSDYQMVLRVDKGDEKLPIIAFKAGEIGYKTGDHANKLIAALIKSGEAVKWLIVQKQSFDVIMGQYPGQYPYRDMLLLTSNPLIHIEAASKEYSSALDPRLGDINSNVFYVVVIEKEKPFVVTRSNPVMTVTEKDTYYDVAFIGKVAVKVRKPITGYDIG